MFATMKMNAIAQEMAQTMVVTLYIIDSHKIKLKSFSAGNTIYSAE
jgi:hypothetical protein